MALPDWKNSNVKVVFPAPGQAQVGVALYLNVDEELRTLLQNYWAKTSQSPSIAFSKKNNNEEWQKIGNAKLFAADEKNDRDTSSYSAGNEYSQPQRPESYQNQPAATETPANATRSFRK
tara:strand:- start:505 stop:864 length:360 start_codon:yes stop_codon:yes gene_type:complete